MNDGAPSPWKIGGLGVDELARRVWTEFWTDEVPDRAAALSYYFLFALFPALLFLTALVAYLPLPGLMDRLMGYLARVLPGDAGTMVQQTLAEVLTTPRGGLLSVGALTALWAASSGMASVITTLNVVYDLTDDRPWWKRRLVAVTLTLGFALMILAGLVLLVFGGKIGAVAAGRLGLGGAFHLVWNVTSILAAIGLVLIGIALVYYLAPAARQRWRWITPGSVVALVLWLGMSFGLRFYVTHLGDYNATYGSIGGVILLMLWLYLTGLVLLLGAEVNAEIEQAAAHRGATSARAPGEREAPADRGAAAAGRDTRAERTPGDRDVAVAAGVVARHAETWRREGWLAMSAVAAGAMIGWSMSRRPVRDVARQGVRAVETGRTVASAIAAGERLTRQRQAARRAHASRGTTRDAQRAA